MRKFIIALIVAFPSCLSQQAGREDFDQFSERFFTDPTFQESRVVFPLHWVQRSESLGHADTMIMAPEQWRFADFGYPQWWKQGGGNEFTAKTYDNYAGEDTQPLRDTGERLIALEGIQDRNRAHLYFNSDDGKWFLSRVQVSYQGAPPNQQLNLTE